ncbi:hypothetical protein CRENPOLYSF2_3960007 [Crenothrix polyspora]|uniref:Uncharacterized protein n=1 Tax=Crenothrix polyspora TaxID=360316 RepID=A0A1R4HDQ4_9GAMM|nr:hypothetical protein CRENPOLYSF2_3960007 [Crenothrix polyspora]
MSTKSDCTQNLKNVLYILMRIVIICDNNSLKEPKCTSVSAKP